MARYILRRRPTSLGSVDFWYPTNDYVNDVSDSNNNTYISTVDPDSTIVYNFSSSQLNGTVENVRIRITAAAMVPGYDYLNCYVTVGGNSYGGTVYLNSTSYLEYTLDVGTPPVANQAFTLTITSGVSTVGIYISEIKVEIQVSDSQTSSFSLTDRWQLVLGNISKIEISIGQLLKVNLGVVLSLSDKLRFFLQRRMVNLVECRKLEGNILEGFHLQARASFETTKIKKQFSVKLGPSFAFSQASEPKVFAVSSKSFFAYKRKISTYHQKLPSLPAGLKIHFKF